MTTPPKPPASLSMDLSAATKRVLDSLTDAERAILEKRFDGPVNLDDPTLRERIKKIEARALAKLAAKKTTPP